MLKRIPVIVLLIISALRLDAQTENRIIGFRLDGDAKRTRFQFELVNNLIIVPVTLNDSLKLYFILDTGVRTTILTNNQSNIFNLEGLRQLQISGLGQARQIAAYAVPNVKIQLPGITGIGQTLVVLGEDYLNLRSHLGREVHGILGYDFFSHFVVRINYATRTLTVYAHEYFKPPGRFSQSELFIESGRPYAKASLVQRNGTVVEGMFLLDTGASHSLLLETDRNPDLYLPFPNIPAVVGFGLGGEVHGHLARIERFNFQQFKLRKVIASYGSGLYNSVSDSIMGRIGTIGGELISRFTVIFDYSQKKIYLKPNGSFRRSFTYNMSGIDVIADGNDFKTFTVAHVNPYSAAWVSGLRQGDVLLAVNQFGAGELSLEKINTIFRSDPGSVVLLLVRRDKEVFTVRFRLRKLI